MFEGTAIDFLLVPGLLSTQAFLDTGNSTHVLGSHLQTVAAINGWSFDITLYRSRFLLYSEVVSVLFLF